MKVILIIFLGVFWLSCQQIAKNSAVFSDSLAVKDTVSMSNPILVDSVLDKKDSMSSMVVLDTQQVVPLTSRERVEVSNVDPEQVIKFAETLVGTPYVYGSTDRKVGFDCSGFVTYVFNHFNVEVPRSSHQFSNVGQTVPLNDAKRGDIILFTDPDFDNTNSSDVGHMGLITANDEGTISFIHSTSGKAMSVVVTPLSDHYKKRFVRVGRIFPQNN
ncbi:MAG TPA: C40 family peptidase [Chitinophagaceae bacterium]|nr:C40 family peptidase [Chitinophagaceae bacterium]